MKDKQLLQDTFKEEREAFNYQKNISRSILQMMGRKLIS